MLPKDIKIGDFIHWKKQLVKVIKINKYCYTVENGYGERFAAYPRHIK